MGATATGKSAVGLELAALLETEGGAEIVNADSMQFYRGMDIGTAKLPESERMGVPHHQIDTLDVHEDASVARFQTQARANIAGIHGRGRHAIVVGGSGLYLRALLDEFEFPGTDPEVRSRLETRAAAEGPGLLYRELSQRDPVAASKIQPQNTKRIVRALEILEVAGSYSSSLPRHAYAIPAAQFALEAPYPVLDERIERRTVAMWRGGLADEVRALSERGLRDSVTARRAVGYAETLRHLDGELDEEATVALIAQHTRRLARKQHRWFGPDPRVTWIAAPGASETGGSAADHADVRRAAKEILDAVRKPMTRGT